MKHFLIKYRFKTGTREAWHEHIQQFIAWLDSEPDVKGKISYRCMKERDGDGYYHLAAASDEQAIKTLQSKDFFKRYTEESKRVAGGEVEVVPLELIAQTS
ncbi:hypothetical protein [Variovorax sp. J31P207]|uniref:hypothetical protein n=1 Tax=Variovorax sp. J31P207 TaxID=3053510 RepID=UPI002578A944|nr:hypothetical protein [Variovorax sp. J31P207]MDM0066476.1 hypothetical protein [Variovorax sp. J31P207]